MFYIWRKADQKSNVFVLFFLFFAALTEEDQLVQDIRAKNIKNRILIL